jgi:hypothetical protein
VSFDGPRASRGESLARAVDRDRHQTLCLFSGVSKRC